MVDGSKTAREIRILKTEKVRFICGSPHEKVSNRNNRKREVHHIERISSRTSRRSGMTLRWIRSTPWISRQ
jgi:hypothetical protein